MISDIRYYMSVQHTCRNGAHRLRHGYAGQADQGAQATERARGPRITSPPCPRATSLRNGEAEAHALVVLVAGCRPGARRDLMASS